jgi:membrane-bound metal-dependent hydrolase YbcI (DUF457 family)
VAVGVLTHIAGDALTCGGVPVPLIWTFSKARVALLPLRTGATIEKAVLVPAFLLAALVFAYLNTIPGQALDPLVQRLLALG